MLLARPTTIESAADDLTRFLDATRRGYEFAAVNPEEAASILGSTAEGAGLDDDSFLEESQRRIADAYLEDGTWGRMRRERWAAFVEWLADESLVETLDGDRFSVDEVDVDTLYTNALFE